MNKNSLHYAAWGLLVLGVILEYGSDSSASWYPAGLNTLDASLPAGIDTGISLMIGAALIFATEHYL